MRGSLAADSRREEIGRRMMVAAGLIPCAAGLAMLALSLWPATFGYDAGWLSLMTAPLQRRPDCSARPPHMGTVAARVSSLWRQPGDLRDQYRRSGVARIAPEPAVHHRMDLGTVALGRRERRGGFGPLSPGRRRRRADRSFASHAGRGRIGPVGEGGMPADEELSTARLSSRCVSLRSA